MLGSHQDFIQPLVRTVDTSPLSIQIPVVGSQWASSNHLVAKRDGAIQVGTLVIARSPRSATLTLAIQQGLGQEVGCGVLGPSTVATPLILWQHLISLFEVVDNLVQSLLLAGTLKALLNSTVGRLGLEYHATILAEQAIIVVATQEVSLAKSLVARIFLRHVIGLADNQVGGRDTVVHLIPEGRYTRTVLIGSTQSRCTVLRIQTVVVGVPRLSGQVGTIGKLITSIQGDTIGPLVTEVPADVCIKSSSHLQSTSLVFKQCIRIKMSGIFLQKIVAT